MSRNDDFRDLSRDELRRQVSAAHEEQDAVLPMFRELLSRVFGDGEAKAAAQIDSGAAIRRIERRQLFRIGGFAVATSAVLAACGKGKGAAEKVPRLGEVPTTTVFPARCSDDIVLLRTSASLELAAIEAYNAAFKLITDPTARSAAGMFADHHRQHAALFDRAARDLGDLSTSVANPALMTAVIKPALDKLTDQAGAVAFAHTLENVAAATYQAFASALTTGTLRQAAMSVGGVEARHAAVLAGLIKGSEKVAGADKLVTAPTTAATTTVAGETTTAAPAVAEPVYQVPGPFGSVAAAIGPNSYIYRAGVTC
ncbi:MAG: ferritin-like domain-containing protein [Acidimicrobiia bacterium]